MRILINKTSQEAKKYSLLSKCSIIPIGEAGDITSKDVAALIEDDGFEETLSSVMGLCIPTVVIASKNSVCYEQAAGMVHADALIYYEDGKILSCEKVFAQAPGLSVKTLISICEYAIEKKLYPDIYIWKPQGAMDSTGSNSVVNDKHTVVEEKTETAKPSLKQTKQGQTRGYTGANDTFQNYLSGCDKIIAVLQTSQSADSSRIASDIAKKLNTVYLNISANSERKEEYDYAFSDGSTVYYNSSFMPGQYIVVEVDIQVPDVLELIHDKAYKLVHVVGEPSESINPLKSWLSSGCRLDAVIPDDPSRLSSYAGEFPACSIDEFITQL